MKSLANKANVNPADYIYPFGDVRDKTLSIPGTKWNRDMMSDIFQLMEKMIFESGVTPNETDDNETNGYQLYEAFRKLTKPYKSYPAIHKQTGTSAPTTTPLISQTNEIGTIVWTRTGVGEYVGTLSGAFPLAKTMFLASSTNQTFSIGGDIAWINADSIKIRTFSTDALSDSISNFSFEIRVYD
jgi:hypothetical protein